MALRAQDLPRPYSQVFNITAKGASTGATAITKANAGKFYAVVQTAVLPGDDGKPTYALSPTPATATSPKIGEYRHFTKQEEIEVQFSGIMYVRVDAAIVAADIGKGLETHSTAGVMSVKASGAGSGIILGGHTIDIGGTDVHVAKIYVA